MLSASVVLLHNNARPHTSWRFAHLLQEFTGRCLIIHSIAQTLHPVISIFSYIPRNSCPVSVSIFRVTERRRWVSHSGCNPRFQTSTTQGYKSWSHGMTNVSIPGVNMLKNSSTLAVSVPINLSIKLVFASVNGPKETYFVDMLHTNLNCL